jgi:tRNA/tmRNA/rRNA uracil-C5-methylase (TrmA/RlmC/RlmD family)
MSDRSDGAIGTLAPEDGDDVVLIESLDLEARGIARREGKVIFVRNALPTERVRLEYVRRRPKFEVAEVAEWLEQASARERPRCPNFGVCGGCSMQHLGTRAQVAIKRRHALAYWAFALGADLAADFGAGLGVPLSCPFVRKVRRA